MTSKSFLALLLLISSFAYSQFKFGAKAGLNYDSLGDLELTELNAENINSDTKTGFHIGVFGHVDLLTFYLRPELQFTKSENQFDDNGFNLQKLEAPVLLGYKILGPLSVFAGPSFQYILAEKAENLNISSVEEDFTVGLQLGTRLQLGRFGLGIRFDRGFTDNEVTILGNNDIDIAGKIDTRQKQWIVSLSYDLKLKKNGQNND